jgi:hypothetical protein
MANKLSKTKIYKKYERIRNIAIFKTVIICLFEFLISYNQHFINSIYIYIFFCTIFNNLNFLRVSLKFGQRVKGSPPLL